MYCHIRQSFIFHLSEVFNITINPYSSQVPSNRLVVVWWGLATRIWDFINDSSCWKPYTSSIFVFVIVTSICIVSSSLCTQSFSNGRWTTLINIRSHSVLSSHKATKVVYVWKWWPDLVATHLRSPCLYISHNPSHMLSFAAVRSSSLYCRSLFGNPYVWPNPLSYIFTL